METINSAVLLKEAIVELEIKKIEQGRIIKEQFEIIRENLKLSNIVSNTLDEVKSSSKLRSNLMGALVGLGAGYISKRIVTGNAANPVRRLIGNILQVGITAVMAKKSDLFQTIGKTFIERVFTKKKSYEPYQYN